MPIDPSIPQCDHIKVNGVRCGSPSLRGRKFCYFHYNVTRSLISTDIPVIEDINSVQYSLNRLAEYILEKRIDYKQASLLIWIMQIAAHNARRTQLEPLPDHIVTQHPNDRYFPNHLSPEEMTAQISAALSDPTWSSPRDSAAGDSVIAVSPEDLEALAPAAPVPAASDSPGVEHGFNRAVSQRKNGALAPEVASASDSAPRVSGHGFSHADSKRKSGASAPEVNSASRKRPTRQALETGNRKLETVRS